MNQQQRQQIQQQTQQIWQQNQENQQKSQQIQQLEREKQQTKWEWNQAIQEKERQLGRVNQQLEESKQLIGDFGKRNTELEEQLRVMRIQLWEKDGGAKTGAVNRTNLKLRWRKGEKAPSRMSRSCDAVLYNNTVYICYIDHYGLSNILYAYHIPSSSWSPIPDCPHIQLAFAVIDGLLTAVGGWGGDGKNTNKLLSLTGEGTCRR